MTRWMNAARWSALGAAALGVWVARSAVEPFPPAGEFHFVRMEYRDHPSARRFRGGRGWWMQDWPEADEHFAQGVRRLLRVQVGENKHHPLTSGAIFEYPWLYATQTGYWDLADIEIERLREYLRRGGFLVTDDFHGPREWEAFRETMERVFPGHPAVDISDDDEVLHIVYGVKDRTYIPGLRHLRRGPGGTIAVEPQYTPPYWRAIHDERGRMVVAVNYNQDVGDAWEHADMPEYPAEMTQLAYRFGLNYIVYAMTH